MDLARSSEADVGPCRAPPSPTERHLLALLPATHSIIHAHYPDMRAAAPLTSGHWLVVSRPGRDSSRSSAQHPSGSTTSTA
ncbi:hypothetical protein C8Q80DRAFT_1149997 [Daedaleopsis nitida]|nr:hypothetical protein C8Q80DRAFT_1149997 [Daedaleopsis nitida]